MAVAHTDWIDQAERYDRMLHRFGRDAITAGAPRAGEAVLDVGCGTGAFTLELARRVEPGGEVVGVDIDLAAIEAAERRAARLGIGSVRFVRADVATTALGHERFDLVASRFGAMLFADPVPAYRQLRTALRPGGRLVAVVWREPAANYWFSLPAAAVARHADLALLARDAHTPGPFAFSDPETVRSILTAAGFVAVRVDPLDGLVPVGTDLGDALEFFDATLGARLGDLPALGAIREELASLLRPHTGLRGVEVPAAAWLIRARREPEDG